MHGWAETAKTSMQSRPCHCCQAGNVGGPVAGGLALDSCMTLLDHVGIEPFELIKIHLITIYYFLLLFDAVCKVRQG